MYLSRFTMKDRLHHGWMHFCCIWRAIRAKKSPWPFIAGVVRTFFTVKY